MVSLHACCDACRQRHAQRAGECPLAQRAQAGPQRRQARPRRGLEKLQLQHRPGRALDRWAMERNLHLITAPLAARRASSDMQLTCSFQCRRRRDTSQAQISWPCCSDPRQYGLPWRRPRHARRGGPHIWPRAGPSAGGCHGREPRPVRPTIGVWHASSHVRSIKQWC